MNHLMIDIHEWANSVIPDRDDKSMFLKMYEELAELMDAETEEEIGGEIADLLIMILDYARRKNVNPSVAVQRKLQVLRNSTFRQLPSGVYKRVK